MEAKVGEPSRGLTKCPSDGFYVRPLLKLPLVLLLPPKCKWKSAEELWKNGRIEPKIVCLPDKHSITRHFREGLKQRGISDFPVMEMETTELIETYVREQYGVGVSVAVPNSDKIKDLRVLPLPDFAPVTFGLLWQPEPNPQMKAFIEAAIRHTKQT